MGSKMKKIALMTTLLTGLTLSQGSTHAINRDKLKGFYIGGGIGAMALSTNFEVDSLANTSSKKIKRSLFAGNASFNGTIGYEKTFGDNYFAGIEAQYIFGRNSINTANTLTSGPLNNDFIAESKVKSTNTYGMSATFGRTFNKLTPYAKAGISSTTFEVGSFNSAQNINGSDKKRLYGLSTGLGLRYHITENLDLITEFQAFLYKSSSSRNLDADAADRHIITLSPNLYNIWTGVRWKV